MYTDEITVFFQFLQQSWGRFIWVCI